MFYIINIILASTLFLFSGCGNSESGKTAPYSPADCNKSGGCFVFLKYDKEHGAEPWISDGSAKGSQLLFDFNTASLGSEPHDFIQINKKLYFLAKSDHRGEELHVLDLYTNKVSLLTDLTPGPSSSNIHNMVAFNNNYLFFTLVDDDYIVTLYGYNAMQGTMTKLERLGGQNNKLSYYATKNWFYYFIESYTTGESTLIRTNGQHVQTVSSENFNTIWPVADTLMLWTQNKSQDTDDLYILSDTSDTLQFIQAFEPTYFPKLLFTDDEKAYFTFDYIPTKLLSFDPKNNNIKEILAFPSADQLNPYPEQIIFAQANDTAIFVMTAKRPEYVYISSQESYESNLYRIEKDTLGTTLLDTLSLSALQVSSHLSIDILLNDKIYLQRVGDTSLRIYNISSDTWTVIDDNIHFYADTSILATTEKGIVIKNKNTILRIDYATDSPIFLSSVSPWIFAQDNYYYLDVSSNRLYYCSTLPGEEYPELLAIDIENNSTQIFFDINKEPAHSYLFPSQYHYDDKTFFWLYKNRRSCLISTDFNTMGDQAKEHSELFSMPYNPSLPVNHMVFADAGTYYFAAPDTSGTSTIYATNGTKEDLQILWQADTDNDEEITLLFHLQKRIYFQLTPSKGASTVLGYYYFDTANHSVMALNSDDPLMPVLEQAAGYRTDILYSNINYYVNDDTFLRHYHFIQFRDALYYAENGVLKKLTLDASGIVHIESMAQIEFPIYSIVGDSRGFYFFTETFEYNYNSLARHLSVWYSTGTPEGTIKLHTFADPINAYSLMVADSKLLFRTCISQGTTYNYYLAYTDYKTYQIDPENPLPFLISEEALTPFAHPNNPDIILRRNNRTDLEEYFRYNVNTHEMRPL